LLAVGLDGSFVYTPTINFIGTDTFTYTVSDGVLTDTAQVSIDVIPRTPITVAITRQASDALLTWQHDPEYTSYQVWSSDSPYFVPGEAGSANQGTLLPPGTGSTLVFTDTGAIGNVSIDTYYLVRGLDALSAQSFSNRTGEFAIPLSSGWNLLSWPLVPITTTLDGLLGDQLYGTADPQTADQVLVWDGVTQSYDSAWFCGGPACAALGPPWANHWLANDYSPSPLGLPADSGFWLQNRSGLTETLVIVGGVAEVDRSVSIGTNWQMLGSAFPFSKPLNSAELPATGTDDPQTADQVFYWDAASQSYSSAWFCGGTNCESWGPPWANTWLANDYSPSTITLQPGGGFWYQDRHTPYAWTNRR
jgi:hypothetical protein